jgi:tight adherence protein C
MAPDLILTIVAVFAAVAFGVGALAYYFLVEVGPERRRFERAVGQPAASGVLVGKTSLSERPTDFAKRMTALVPRSPKEMTRLRRRMVRAGYYTLTPVALFTLAQMTLPIVLALSVLLFGPLRVVWPGMIVLALLGYVIPGFLLDFRISARQKIIRNGLPDALDLLIVCLESGSAMDQAIMKVSDELALPYPALAEELKMIITETRAGKPRIEAFRNFAERTGVDDVRALVAMLVQTDRFGTSVSQALRTHAETSRTKRRQRAEERAAKIGVKLVFPLVFLLFPAFFVVTIGPAVIRFMRVLFGDIMGQ